MCLWSFRYFLIFSFLFNLFFTISELSISSLSNVTSLHTLYFPHLLLFANNYSLIFVGPPPPPVSGDSSFLISLLSIFFYSPSNYLNLLNFAIYDFPWFSNSKDLSFLHFFINYKIIILSFSGSLVFLTLSNLSRLFKFLFIEFIYFPEI